MTRFEWIMTGLEALSWYGFFYYGLYALKNDVSLIWAALFLVLLFYAAIISSPFIRHTPAWKELTKK